MTMEASINRAAHQLSWDVFPSRNPSESPRNRQEDLSNQQEHFDSVMIDEVKAWKDEFSIV